MGKRTNKEIFMTYKELIKICKKCVHRVPHDDMYSMSWWSFCQTECKNIKQARKDDGLKGARSFNEKKET